LEECCSLSSCSSSASKCAIYRCDFVLCCLAIKYVRCVAKTCHYSFTKEDQTKLMKESKSVGMISECSSWFINEDREWWACMSCILLLNLVVQVKTFQKSCYIQNITLGDSSSWFLKEFAKNNQELRTFSYRSPYFCCMLVRSKMMFLAQQDSFVGQ
jgi:hypothetical protein